MTPRRQESVDLSRVTSYLQVVLLIIFFILFPLALDPVTLIDPIPPGTELYIYVLWPKLAILAVLFTFLVVTASLNLSQFKKDETARRTLAFVSAPLCIFLTLYIISNAVVRNEYLTSYEVIFGQVIHGDGLVPTIVWWLLIPTTMVAFYRTRVTWRSVMVILMVSLLICAVWSLLGTFNFNPVKWINPMLNAQNANAGFGNRSWAGYLFGTYYILLYSFLNRAGLPRLFYTLGFPLLLLNAFVISITGGRVALAIVTTVTLLHLALTIRKQRPPSLFVVTTLLTVVAMFAGYRSGLADVERLTGIAHFQSDGGFTHRLIPWKAGLREIRRHPLTGNHSERTEAIIWKNLNPDETKELLTEFAPREVIFGGYYKFKDGYLQFIDEATKTVNINKVNFTRFHNQYIEITVRGGLVTLASYVALLAALGITFVRFRNQYGVAGLLLLICYATYNMVWFTSPVVEPFILFLIGLTLSYGLSGHAARAVPTAAP